MTSDLTRKELQQTEVAIRIEQQVDEFSSTQQHAAAKQAHIRERCFTNSPGAVRGASQSSTGGQRCP
jgi:hypothetical protein